MGELVCSGNACSLLFAEMLAAMFVEMFAAMFVVIYIKCCVYVSVSMLLVVSLFAWIIENVSRNYFKCRRRLFLRSD